MMAARCARRDPASPLRHRRLDRGPARNHSGAVWRCRGFSRLGASPVAGSVPHKSGEGPGATPAPREERSWRDSRPTEAAGPAGPADHKSPSGTITALSTHPLGPRRLREASWVSRGSACGDHGRPRGFQEGATAMRVADSAVNRRFGDDAEPEQNAGLTPAALVDRRGGRISGRPWPSRPKVVRPRSHEPSMQRVGKQAGRVCATRGRWERGCGRSVAPTHSTAHRRGGVGGSGGQWTRHGGRSEGREGQRHRPGGSTSGSGGAPRLTYEGLTSRRSARFLLSGRIPIA